MRCKESFFHSYHFWVREEERVERFQCTDRQFSWCSVFHCLSACSHRHLSWQLQQFDEERKRQPINRLFLKPYFLHLKKRFALELPKVTIFGQPSLSFSWVMISSIKLWASTNHTASLVRAIVAHIAYAHQGAGCIEDSQRLTDHHLPSHFPHDCPMVRGGESGTFKSRP